MTLTLYTREGCHLCHRLVEMIQPWLDEHHITLERCDIETNDVWYETYRSRIPALTCDNRVILEGKPDEEQVRTTMNELIARNNI